MGSLCGVLQTRVLYRRAYIVNKIPPATTYLTQQTVLIIVRVWVWVCVCASVGVHRGMSPSLPVHTSAQRPRRATSPRRTDTHTHILTHTHSYETTDRCFGIFKSLTRGPLLLLSCVSVCVRVCMCVCMCVRVSAYVCVCVFVWV